MLIEFRVKNYRSIGEEQVFSFVAGAEKRRGKEDDCEDPRVVACPPPVGLRLLKSCVIYGANAAGKSNLLRALATVRNIVVNSSDNKPGDLFEDAESFAFDIEYKKAPIEFEITFLMEGIRYQYGVAFNAQRICEEWLIYYPKGRPASLFERSAKKEENENIEIEFGTSMKGEKKSIAQKTGDNVLFLSKGAQEQNPILKKIFLWFRTKLYFVDMQYPGDIPYLDTAKMFNESDSARERITKLIQYADFGIQALTVKLMTVEESPFYRKQTEAKKKVIPSEVRSGNYLDVRALHSTGADQFVSLGMEDESDGTQRYFGMSGLILGVLESGGILVVDELDASLHPLLVRRIVEMFHDPEINKNNAQLLFATHDTTLLSPTLFRRDQVWFVEKDERGQSQFYSLLDYKREGKGRVRKDEAWERGYLQGRYGAVPFLGEFSF